MRDGVPARTTYTHDLDDGPFGAALKHFKVHDEDSLKSDLQITRNIPRLPSL
jgi:hypothetical protein